MTGVMKLAACFSSSLLLCVPWRDICTFCAASNNMRARAPFKGGGRPIGYRTLLSMYVRLVREEKSHNGRPIDPG